MKYYLATARNFVLVALATTALLFFIHTLEPRTQPINAPAIAEWQQTEHVRQLMSPITFDLKMNVYAAEKDAVSQKEKTWICASGAGTVFAHKKIGHFLTNHHVIDPEYVKTGCLYNLAKERNVPISSLSRVQFRVEYFLTNADKVVFPVHVVHSFPEIDVAVLNAEKNILTAPIYKNWKSVDFRTGSPKIVDGKIVLGKGPMVLPDEPVATMGSPLYLPFTIIKGTLGNNTFSSRSGIPLIHFIAPINSGNSGGPLISLLDFKVIGMTTMSKADYEGNDRSLQSGAVPFWEIQKALRSVGLE
ncbi:MAG: serine protease [Candidatus Paceibacterota bacterium]|jgi:S1-C subfamily serine protease|nr:serine protease [Candidatus Paceibacterota bacterium]